MAGLSYEGRRVVVTGAASGMGEATARIVADLGADVVAVDIKQPQADVSAFHEVDLRDRAAIDDAVDAIASGGTIDRVFYCAGMPGTFGDLDVMTVNFVALRYFNERCVTHMPRDGAIASVSSAAGVGYMAAMDKVLPLLDIDDWDDARAWVEANLTATGFDAYTFSKMCTILWTLRRGYHITTDTGVRVNCIAPGPTDTPMMPHFHEQAGRKFMDAYPKPVGRNSTPDEQAWVLAFLNSDVASYVTAENVFTDGGGSGGMLTGQVDLSEIIHLMGQS